MGIKNGYTFRGDICKNTDPVLLNHKEERLFGKNDLEMQKPYAYFVLQSAFLWKR